MQLDLKGQAGFPGWGAGEGKAWTPGEAGRQEPGGMGLQESGKYPAVARRAIWCPQPQDTGLLQPQDAGLLQWNSRRGRKVLDYAGLRGLEYLRGWDDVTGSISFISFSFEIILDF